MSDNDKPETIDAADLQLDAANVRRHTDRNKRAIEDSLRQFGAGRSVLLDKDGIVRAGNGTVKAWKRQGGKVRVIETDGSELIAVKRVDLDGVKATAYAIADNRTTDLSEFDEDELNEQLTSLQESKFDLELLGFNEDELEKLLGNDEFPDEEDVQFVAAKSEEIFEVVVSCKSEEEQRKVFEKMEGEGYSCRVLTV